MWGWGVLWWSEEVGYCVVLVYGVQLVLFVWEDGGGMRGTVVRGWCGLWGWGGMWWYCGGGWCGLTHAACLCGKAGLFPSLPFGCCGD